MRKIFILLGIMVISFTLVACTGGEDVKTPPTYLGIKVEDTLPIEGTDYVTYYRPRQETVSIEISVDNPDNLPIKSVVVNGITFNSHRFDEFSTNTLVLFEMNVGNTLGETIYSVDEINYLDGENTLTIDRFSNNEFRVYVFKSFVEIERDTFDTTKDSVTVTFDITDTDQVIDISTLVAEIYEGEILKGSQPLSIGEDTVTFTGLFADTTYDVKIEGTYDLDDGNGTVENYIFYDETYSTKSNGLPTAVIQNVEITSTDVIFDVDFTDDDNVTDLSSLYVEIYRGEVKLTDDEIDYEIEISGSDLGLQFRELLTDNEYTIIVRGDYNLNDGQGVKEGRPLGSYTFTTPAREIPIPSIENLNLLENSIEFDIEIDDPYGIIFKDTIYANLYIDNVLIDSAEVDGKHVDLQINNLFADSSIYIEIYGNYNLLDGNGTLSTLLFNETYSTQINERPSIHTNEIIVEQGYVTINFEAVDENNTLIGLFDAVLYEDDVEVGRISFDTDASQVVFEYPTYAETNYYIEFVADYNLRDGNPAQYDQLLRRIVSYTKEDKAPIAEIHDVVTDTERIDFKLVVIDADETIVPNSVTVYLYLNGELKDTITDLNEGTHTLFFDDDIRSNNEYEILVKANYDLDDNSGELVDQLLLTEIVETLAKVVPTAEYRNENATTETISFDLEITDPDSVIDMNSITATLYFEGLPVQTHTDLTYEEFGILFNDLSILSDNYYEVVVSVTYNLNDGEPSVTIPITTFAIETVAKVIPNATFEYQETTKQSIIVDVQVNDPDDVVDPASLFVIVLLNGETEVGREALDVGLNSDIEFIVPYANERYYVNVISLYDLNNGDEMTEPDILLSTNMTTLAYLEIDASITEIIATPDSIIIDATIIDFDGVYDDNLEVVAYDADGIAVSSEPLSFGDNDDVEITGLQPETVYNIVIEADYDLHLEDPESIVDGELTSQLMLTEALTPPTENLIVIQSETIGKTTATIEILVDDSENILTTEIVATLKQANGDDFTSYVIAPNSVTTLDLYNLLSSNIYEIEFTASYDSGTGIEPYSFTHEFQTEDMLIPTVSIEDVTAWTSPDLTFDVTLGTDDDNIANDSSWEVVLYRNGSVLDTFDLDVAAPGGVAEGNVTTVTFTGVDHLDGELYTVVVRGMIDLNKVDPDDVGSGEQWLIVGSRSFIDADN